MIILQSYYLQVTIPWLAFTIMSITLENVRDQYEDLPYPHRDPENEKKELIMSSYDSPDLLNHICYGGKRDFTKTFRILVAGGGAGDSTVYLAEVFREFSNVEIIYLDFSSGSRKVAERRLEIRGLTGRIKFITDSLLNIPQLNLGKFDLIQCSGVLHHLSVPQDGLNILAESLADDGALSLMIYGAYGRYGVYPIQSMMRMINQGETDKNKKIQNTINAINSFPTNNYFKENLKSLSDIKNPAGIYDLFLHEQDRAYTIPETYEFIEAAGLKIIEFIKGYGLGTRDFLEPENYIKNPDLLKIVKSLPLSSQYGISEVMNSRLSKHSFFAAKKLPEKVELELDAIPSFSLILPDSANNKVADLISETKGDEVGFTLNNMPIKFSKTANLAQIFKLIDGTSSFRKIFEKIGNAEELLEEFRPVYKVFNNNYVIFLRKSGNVVFDNIYTLQERVSKMYKKAGN